MYENQRHSVISYPDGYAVIDKQNENRIVFSTANRDKAHAEARRLNRGQRGRN